MGGGLIEKAQVFMRGAKGVAIVLVLLAAAIGLGWLPVDAPEVQEILALTKAALYTAFAGAGLALVTEPEPKEPPRGTEG